MPTRHNNSLPITFSSGMIMLLYILLGFCLFINEGLYYFIAFLALILVIKMLWKINTPGVLIFAYIFQWLQICFFIIWMNLLGRGMNGLTLKGSQAFYVAIVGLLIMVFVTMISIGKLDVYNFEDFKKAADRIDHKRLLVLYLVSTFFLTGIGFIFGVMSGFAQILVSISSLKWVFFIWLAAVLWVKKANRSWILIIIIYEFVIGLYSYFSTFKDVILYVLILSLTFITVIKFKEFIRFVLIGFFLGFILLSWTAIKSDYRLYLNQGTRQQQVNVTRSEALNKVAEQVSKLDLETYERAMGYTAYRLQYLYHFALSMEQVPEKIPYQEGAIWSENIGYVLTPRILNPNKKAYNASEKASRFTGKRFAGLKEGSSFSLGYFADSYVDFGIINMMFVLVLIAFFASFVYKLFYRMSSLNLLLRFAIVNVSLYVFITFEADGLYLFGRMLTDLIVFYLLSKYFFPYIQKWVYIN